MNDTSIDGQMQFAKRLGDFCRQHATERSKDAVSKAAELVIMHLLSGHTCTLLDSLCEQYPGLWTKDEVRALLQSSGVVATTENTAPLPLTLSNSDRVYVTRLFRAEQRLAASLRERLSKPLPALTEASQNALRALKDQPGINEGQLVAIAAAVRASFCVITGGPGTGKTTTVSHLLDTLRLGSPDLRIALAAPTGKASSRLGEALALTNLANPPKPTTLHRLLEYLPDEDRFRRDRKRQLAVDVLIIDESSMIDLELLLALFDALPADARLVLLGDPGQLASVGTGQVLADLCRIAMPHEGPGRELAAFCRANIGLEITHREVDQPLANVIVSLRQNYRFNKQPGIGSFASAVADNNAALAMAALRHGHLDLQLKELPDPQEVVALIKEHLLASFAADSPAAALIAMDRSRILCATRKGPCSVEAANRAVEHLLRQQKHNLREPNYHGRPILITQNDQTQGLYNGNLGIIWRKNDQCLAYFGGKGEPLRAVLPQRLPAHETAFAMTVHKSQGSEFDHVLLWLPDRLSPLLDATLIYTAVTRAKLCAIIVGKESIVGSALRAQPDRNSGLAELLC
ncbi:MAG: exodeoxyribonuclease V subunit alpha [Planctomycetota bacterium]|nr:exodeoxyribonuclease V subunit alpha [Planctomycetota bacterium]